MKSAIILGVLLACAAIFVQAETKTGITRDGKFQWTETLVYDKGIGGDMLGQMISPDRQKIALVVGKQGRQAVWCEQYGLSDVYSEVNGLFFSPDSKRFAYVAIDAGGKTVVAVDGQIVGRYAGVFGDEVMFTDSSDDFVFIIDESGSSPSEDKDWLLGGPVVLNGVAGEQYTNILGLNADDREQVMCVDGNRVVYFARQGDEWFAVIDGVRGPSFQQTGWGPVFSDDHTHIAYAGMKDSLWYVVVDSVLHGPYPAVASLDFPPGASEPAYIVEWPDSSRIFINHQIQPSTYKRVKDPVYAESGNLRAYWASDGKKSYVVSGDGSDMSGERKYHSVSTPWISDHGNHCVYEMVFDSDFRRKALVVDGTPLATVECEGSFNVRFSTDGTRFYTSCFQSRPMKCVVSVDGRHGPYEGIWIDPVVFTDDSRHWATRVVTQKKAYLLVDGRKIDVDPVVSSVHFSPDGQHLAYTITQVKGTREFLVIDETEFSAYSGGIGGDEMEFNPDGSLTLFPREKEAKLYRLQITAMP